MDSEVLRRALKINERQLSRALLESVKVKASNRVNRQAVTQPAPPVIEEKRNLKWWALCVTHNIIVHPWLPLADAMDSLGLKKLPKAIWWLHDNTVPPGGG